MWEVNLYIVTEQKGNISERGLVVYEMETTLKNGRKEVRTGRTGMTVHNRNGAMLEGLCDVLARQIKPDMDISMDVYTEAPMMNTHINNGNIYSWEKKGFTKADGSPVTYAGLWQQITRDIREKLKGRITMHFGIPRETKYRLEKFMKEPE